jgi:DNA-binding response OmpR family regulator
VEVGGQAAARQMDKMSHQTPDPTPGAFQLDSNRQFMPAILIVEDDREIREMLCTLMDLAGFSVTACDSAEAGLNALRDNAFDMVLTDYALPRHSGVWLLEHAESEGLIDGVPVMILTAYGQVADADAYEIVQKPFDLDYLVDRVRRRMGAGARSKRPASSGASAPDNDGRSPDCPGSVELILYVAKSPHSDAAIAQMRRILSQFSSNRVRLTLCELPAEVPCGAKDVDLARRTSFQPRTCILGHVTNPEILLELLTDCRV